MSEVTLKTQGRKTEPFATGAKGSGMEVLEHIAGAKFSDMKYSVRYVCCGKQAILTHKQIAQRIHHGNRYCASCALLAAKKTRTGYNSAGIDHGKAIMNNGVQDTTKLGGCNAHGLE